VLLLGKTVFAQDVTSSEFDTVALRRDIDTDADGLVDSRDPTTTTTVFRTQRKSSSAPIRGRPTPTATPSRTSSTPTPWTRSAPDPWPAPVPRRPGLDPGRSARELSTPRRDRRAPDRPRPGAGRRAGCEASGQAPSRRGSRSGSTRLRATPERGLILSRPREGSGPDARRQRLGGRDLHALGTGAWSAKSFTAPFAGAPTLFLTVQTYSGAQPVTVKARSVTAAGFEAALFEKRRSWRAATEPRPSGTSRLFSVDSGTVDLAGSPTPYLLQSAPLDHRWAPVWAATLRLEEEQSADPETDHPDETVHVLALGPHLFAQIASDTSSDTVAVRCQRQEDPSLVEWGVVDPVDNAWTTVPLAKPTRTP